MAVLDTFLLLFEADASKLKAGLADAESKAGEMAKAISKVDAQARRLGNDFLGIVKSVKLINIGAKAIRGFWQLSEAVAGQNAELGKQANVLQMDAGRFQQWQGAFEAAGSSGEAFAGLFQKLRQYVQDPEAHILRIADTMRGLSERQRFSYGKALGIDQEAVDLLAKGRQGVEEYLRREKELGLVTLEDIKRSKEFNEQKRAAGRLFEALKNRITMSVLPAFKWALESLQKFIRFIRDNEQFVSLFFAGMATVITALFLPAMANAAAAMLIAAAATLIWLAPFLLIAAAVAAITLAVATIALAIDDVITYIKGGDSMLGRWAEKFSLLGAALRGIKNLFGEIADFVENVIIPVAAAFGDALSAAFDVGKGAWVDFYEGYLRPVFGFLMEAAGLFGDIFTLNIEGIESRLTKMYEYVKKTFGWMLDKAKDIVAPIANLWSGDDGGDIEVRQAREISANIEKGQQALGQAHSPLAAQPPNVQNMEKTATVQNNANLSVGEINVHTQATDAQGMAQGAKDALFGELRGANAQFANGVQG